MVEKTLKRAKLLCPVQKLLYLSGKNKKRGHAVGQKQGPPAPGKTIKNRARAARAEKKSPLWLKLKSKSEKTLLKHCSEPQSKSVKNVSIFGGGGASRRRPPPPPKKTV